MITLSQAKNLGVGQVLYAVGRYNADGTAMRARVSGRVQTWKTRPSEVRIPYKRGLYEHGHLYASDLKDFSLTEPPPRKPASRLVRKRR